MNNVASHNAPYLLAAIHKELSENPNSLVSTMLKNSDSLFTIDQQERSENGTENDLPSFKSNWE